MQFHILALFSGISSLISSRKRALSPPPSLSLLGEAPSPPFLRYGVSHFSLSGTLPFTANEKDPSASLGMTIRETCFPLFFYLALVIHPADRHFERSEKSFSSPFSHDSFAKPFRGSTVPAFPAIRRFPFLATKHSPSCRQRKRSLGFARDDNEGIAFSKHIHCTLREINPFPHTVISSAARNLPCTLFFLAPFTEGFPFSAVSHTALYRCARKIEGFARDDVAEAAFSQHILYTGRGLSIPPLPSFRAQREIFLALCSFLLLSQKGSPFPLSHIRRYTGVPERSLHFGRDDDTRIAFYKHIRCTLRGINPFPPYRHFEHSEKSSLHAVVPYSFR